MMTQELKRAFKMTWICRTRGERPSDAGVSWHASVEDGRSFVSQYHEAMPSATPSSYLASSGRLVEELCEENVITALRASPNGVYVTGDGDFLGVAQLVAREVESAAQLDRIDARYGGSDDAWNPSAHSPHRLG